MKIEPGPWRELGEVRLGTDGKLLMPDPGRGPGIYRFRLIGAVHGACTSARAKTWADGSGSIGTPKPASERISA
jgi:hypothetical protein